MDISLDDFLYNYVMNNYPMLREENIKRYIAVNSHDLLIEFNNGEKRLYDTLLNTWRYITYDEGELTDEQELYEFKTLLRKIMQRKFIDQTELARRVGVSQGMISNYMRGYSIPNALMLKKLARALDCSIDDFFYKEH